MKVGGVSEQERMDALFFKAVDKAVGNGSDFQSVLRQNKGKTASADFTEGFEISKEPAKGAGLNSTVKQTDNKEKEAVTPKEAGASAKNVKTAKANETGNAAEAKNEPLKAETAKAAQETEISNETIEALSAAIVEVVSQILNIEPQQLEDLLSETQINPIELLQPEKLMELLLETSETGDITELLTNEALAGRLKEMEDALEKFDLSQYGTTKEQLEALLSGQKAELVDSSVEAAKEDVSDKEVLKDEKPLVNAGEEQKAGNKAAVNDKPEQPADKVEVVDLRRKPEVSEDGENEDRMSDDEKNRQTEHTVRQTHTEGNERAGATEQFINQLATAAPQSEYTGDVVNQTVVMYREIVDQIVQQIRVVIRPDQTSMNMQLMPENLGRVYVNMTAKNGVVTATFLVQNEIAKEAIEANLEVFKQNLNEQGTKVEAVEVDVADFTFGQKDAQEETAGREEQEESNNSKTGRRMSLSELTAPEEELSEEEQAAVGRMLQNGSTVEYTA